MTAFTGGTSCPGHPGVPPLPMTRDLRLTPALVARISNGVGAPPEAAGLVAATDTDHRQVLDDILRTPPARRSMSLPMAR